MDKRQTLTRLLADHDRPPLVMGVVNVTPDSFYDGGRYATTEAAVARGIELVEAGADILDVGGESTRPGAPPVPEQEELQRVAPVVQRLCEATDVPISVDTRKAAVAQAALEAGAAMVNDVSGFTYDRAMLDLLAEKKPLALVMHMRGTPADMQEHTTYASVLWEVLAELWERVRRVLQAGLPRACVVVDPGIGFAKTPQQNLEILANLDVFVRMGFPVCVGVSRKSFIGYVLEGRPPSGRLMGTAGAVALCVRAGVRVVRVHDVAEMRDVVRTAYAIGARTAG